MSPRASHSSPPASPRPPGPDVTSGGLSADARRQVLSQLRRNWSDEVHSANLYRRLARLQPAGEAHGLLVEMADQELRHAEHWRQRIEELGGTPPRARTGLREIVLPMVARFAGLGSVISLIEGGEARGKLAYLRQARDLPDARSRAIASEILPEERRHQGAAARLRIEPGVGAARPRSLSPRAHLGDVIRDLIFGLNDGLLSNFSLIAGVSGGAGSRRSVVLLAGVAGLLAGAVSMAAGSYLSTKSRREVLEEQLERKAEEIEYDPEQEREELRRIYELRGFSAEEVDILVRRVTADRARWLQVLCAEELGFTSVTGPPPTLDAVVTGGGFAAGAVVPLVPFLFSAGTAPLVIAGVLSVLALFAVGSAKTMFTAGRALRSGAEMAVIGVAAAVATNVVGRLFGQSIA